MVGFLEGGSRGARAKGRVNDVGFLIKYTISLNTYQGSIQKQLDLLTIIIVIKVP